MRQVLSSPSQLGPLLKSGRRAAGLPQTELAQRMGISQSRISHMELHPESVNLEQLLALFGLLGMELIVQSRSDAPPAQEW
ncbi:MULTISPECIES: helix-turn-helix domain-containing protein [unclassified Variovorax]|uniref:helix-turn-helix domain-containing protein n=1 Tax=unclassified Variovorax TaxID=663243 RepID=UPI00076C8C49|nr:MULTISPECIES: helix-turn-helix domain-containing protein [unclassified Variovorax]KWT65448.1 Helix-turn-helix XRE-family like protein [Variovorax sp. WDL1]PNG52907.1 Antitoxin HipB [Variovorax sp. B2]PNG53479.1 Antitoxin HipB [Variovorax sp. B4]VTV10893.1 Antitoxin HipB [Variovorax sp. WDL1]